MLIRLTPRHPDVLKKDQEYPAKDRSINRATGKQAYPENESGSLADLPDDPSSAQLRSQAEANAAQIQSLLKEESRLKGSQVELYESPAESSARSRAGIGGNPSRLRSLFEEGLHADLEEQTTWSLNWRQAWRSARKASTSVWESLCGLPAKPSGPKRLEMSLGGIAGGLCLGLVLAFLMEKKDSSFHTEKALKQYFKLPLVLSVPLLLSSREKRRRTWKRASEWLAGCARDQSSAVFAANSMFIIMPRRIWGDIGGSRAWSTMINFSELLWKPRSSRGRDTPLAVVRDYTDNVETPEIPQVPVVEPRLDLTARLAFFS